MGIKKHFQMDDVNGSVLVFVNDDGDEHYIGSVFRTMGLVRSDC